MTMAWQRRYPEKARASKRAWALANPEKVKAHRNKSRAKHGDIRHHRRPVYSPETRAIQKMYTAAKRRSKRRGMLCSISTSDIIIPATCPLLGIPLFIGSKITGSNSPTLDRIDNSLGYIPGNVWVISHKANSCKGNLTADEIIQVGLRLKIHLQSLATECVLKSGGHSKQRKSDEQ